VTPARWTLLVIVLLLLGGLALFTVQNLERSTDLSLDLWVWAGHLQHPQPVPLLLLCAFGLGLVLGGGWGLVGRMRVSSQLAVLEQDLARASLRTSSGSSRSGEIDGGRTSGDDDPWG